MLSQYLTRRNHETLRIVESRSKFEPLPPPTQRKFEDAFSPNVTGYLLRRVKVKLKVVPVLN